MPRAGDPRVAFRIDPADFAVLETAAKSAGVSVGGLARECAVRHAAELARDVREGRVRLRLSKAAEAVGKVEAIRQQVEQPSPPARPPVPSIPGVQRGSDLMLERQRRLNQGR